MRVMNDFEILHQSILSALYNHNISVSTILPGAQRHIKCFLKSAVAIESKSIILGVSGNYYSTY